MTTEGVDVVETLVDLDELFRGWSNLWAPRERVSLSQWAEANFVLSPEYSAGTGPLRLYGWQRGILDSFTDPRVSEIWLMCSTQLIKTLFLQCAIAYTIAEEPGPILLLQPKEADAKSFSKERIAPMCRDIPALQGKVAQVKSRGSNNTILEKTFPGGILALAGGVAPGNAARRSVMVFLADEVDKYPLSAGKEGDILSLGDERTATYGTRAKKARACSPTVKGVSRIGKGYETSDQRKPWAPCPQCGNFQILDFWKGVKWENDDPDTAYYQCAHCPARWNDVQRWAACERVQWRASVPGPFKGIAGFWINHLYSPWKRLRDIVAKYLASKDDPYEYITFVNTNLAEMYEQTGETPDEEVLLARAEDYAFGEDATVPQRALFLLCAVDVQESPPRLEYEVTAWSRERECWSIDYGVLTRNAENGEPLPVTTPELWDVELEKLLQRKYRHASGRWMPIYVMGIDTGSRPQPVYRFAKKHAQPAYGAHGMSITVPGTVIALKGGADAYRVIEKVSKENAARKHQDVRIVTLGTHRIKQEIYDSLRNTKPREDGGPVIGCYHHPKYEKSYFEGVCGEQRIVHDTGKVEWKKRPNYRNEPFDLKVYARGLYSALTDRWPERVWRAFEDALKPSPPDGGQGPGAGGQGPAKAPEPGKRPWLERRGGWLKR